MGYTAMGYETRYNLSILNNTDSQQQNQLIAELRESNVSAKYAIDENGYLNNPTRWYDHEEDMRKFSSKHPETIFELSGEGEWDYDLWFAWFKNGKMQKTIAKILYDEFDEALMK